MLIGRLNRTRRNLARFAVPAPGRVLSSSFTHIRAFRGLSRVRPSILRLGCLLALQAHICCQQRGRPARGPRSDHFGKKRKKKIKKAAAHARTACIPCSTRCPPGAPSSPGTSSWEAFALPKPPPIRRVPPHLIRYVLIATALPSCRSQRLYKDLHYYCSVSSGPFAFPSLCWSAISIVNPTVLFLFLYPVGSGFPSLDTTGSVAAGPLLELALFGLSLFSFSLALNNIHPPFSSADPRRGSQGPRPRTTPSVFFFSSGTYLVRGRLRLAQPDKVQLLCPTNPR